MVAKLLEKQFIYGDSLFKVLGWINSMPKLNGNRRSKQN